MLSNDGYDVSVITGIPNYPRGKIYDGYGFFKKKGEIINGVKVKRLWLIPRGNGSKFRLLINYLSYFISCFIYTLYITAFKKRYDIILVHHTSPILVTIPPILYKYVLNPKMILWDLDMWPDTLMAMDIIKSKKILSILEVCVKWIYRRYNIILVGSKSFVEKAVKRVNHFQVVYFPNWAEEVFFKAEIVTPVQIPVFPQGFNLMYAGNIGEAQDFGNVVKAMVLLKKFSINWLIVGEGRWLKKLKALVVEEGLTDKVYFYGNNPIVTMPYYFSYADVMFLSLQDKEIFSKTVPAKLQSYMATGKPIIGMISGEGNEIIRDANCGYSIPSGDFAGFAKAVKQLNTDSESLEIMGKNSRKYYEENFAFKVRKEQINSIINLN